MTTHEPFRGIFPILQTPFRADDTIDVAALRREVEFVIAAIIARDDTVDDQIINSNTLYNGFDHFTYLWTRTSSST